MSLSTDVGMQLCVISFSPQIVNAAVMSLLLVLTLAAVINDDKCL